MTIAVAASPAADLDELEPLRRELTGYCYRMLGSGFEADDAVQETLVRAWRSRARFEGRSALRSWVYRIATNVCIDMLRGRQRRARPMDLGPASPADPTHLGPLTAESRWLSPVADDRILPGGDPAEVAEGRESVRLAFVAALQHLPARQRSVLILRDVLRWRAAEVAELLDTTPAAVNSTLQRARTTLAEAPGLRAGEGAGAPEVHPVDDAQRELLDAYVEAFESYDVPRLVALLHDDAVQCMPPFAMWLQGSADIGAWMLGAGIGCRGSHLVRAPAANGCPAFGQYRVDPAGGHRAWALLVLETSGDRISALNCFLDTRLFEAFGLPDRLNT
ncbi:MAG: sigma-70 family RNA polymerase sigma factor [Acidimicrobiales bacterium]